MQHPTQARFVLSGLPEEELEQCAVALSEELRRCRGFRLPVVRYDRLGPRVLIEFEAEGEQRSGSGNVNQWIHRELRECLTRTRWIASGVTVEAESGLPPR